MKQFEMYYNNELSFTTTIERSISDSSLTDKMKKMVIDQTSKHFDISTGFNWIVKRIK